MVLRVRRLAAVWVTVVTIAGCGRGGSEGAGTGESSSAAPGRQGGAVGTVGARPPACPRTGSWSACQVRSSLERAGLVARDTALSNDLPSLVVAPISYRLGSASLAVYLFADSGTRARAAGGLDTVRFVASSRPLTMRSVATLIENGNLLALYYGKNEHQRERVSNALTAGAPQP